MTRSALHQLVDDLPEDQIDPAAELLDAYGRGDHVLIQILTAPVVNAERDEIAALEELTDTDRSDVISAEELRSQLGIVS